MSLRLPHVFTFHIPTASKHCKSIQSEHSACLGSQVQVDPVRIFCLSRKSRINAKFCILYIHVRQCVVRLWYWGTFRREIRPTPLCKYYCFFNLRRLRPNRKRATESRWSLDFDELTNTDRCGYTQNLCTAMEVLQSGCDTANSRTSSHHIFLQRSQATLQDS